MNLYNGRKIGKKEEVIGGQNYLEAIRWKNLLKGQDEVTISFDTKSRTDRYKLALLCSTGYQNTKYNSEQYLGVMQQNGKWKIRTL